MSQAIQNINQSITQMSEFSREQIELIKTQCAKGTSDLEFKHFLNVAQMRKLNPLAAQLHCIVRGSGDNRKMTIQVSIDGLRLIAERTGEYGGYDPPKLNFAKPDGTIDNRIPYSCEVTVYRIVQGHTRPFPAIAYFDEFCPTNEKEAWMWRKMPRLMLIKCTMAQALRSAFPQELSGFYSDEEMDQADEPQSIKPTRQVSGQQEWKCAPDQIPELVRAAEDAEKMGITKDEMLQYFPKGVKSRMRLDEKQAEAFLKDVWAEIEIRQEARRSVEEGA